jgi:putative DNA primase/helicase
MKGILKDKSFSELSRDRENNYTNNICNIPLNYPETDGNKILDTRNNLKFLLDIHNITVRWNTMLRLREIFIPDINPFIDEQENASLYEVYQLATTSRMPNTKLDRHLDSLAWKNTYHPIVDCIEKNTWDKVPRLDKFISTLKTKDDNLSYKIIKRWMISAIAAAFSLKGFASQGALVLQGAQGIGKTTWVKSLDPINCGAIKEGLLLDPSDKDSIIKATSCWIGELAELDGIFRKSDLAPLKSYITNSLDILRYPYKPRDTYLARRSVYVATVNESQFLIDDTGNRRWWTIEVESIDFNHKLDMQQIWAEVYDLYKIGNQAFLTKEESNLVNDSNISHEKSDPLKEKLYSRYDFDVNGSRWLSSTQVLEELGFTNPSRSDCTRMGNLLKIASNGQERLNRGYRQYKVPDILYRNNNF